MKHCSMSTNERVRAIPAQTSARIAADNAQRTLNESLRKLQATYESRRS